MMITAPELDSLRTVAARSAPRSLWHWAERPEIAAGADLLVLGLAVAAERLGPGSPATSALSPAWTAAFPIIVVSLLAAGGFYKRRLKRTVLDELRTIAGATAIAAMSTVTLPVLLVEGTSGLAVESVRLWFFATLYLTAMRGGVIVAPAFGSRREFARTPTLIVGAGAVGRLISDRLRDHPELGLQPVGFFDEDPLPVAEEGGRQQLPILGAGRNIGEAIDSLGVQHVLFTFSTAPHDVMLRLLDECAQRGVRVTVVPRLFERMPHSVTLDYLGGVPLVSIFPNRPGSLRFRLKYAFDRVAAAVLLLLLSPALLLLSVGVLISLGRPILFRQTRVGRDGRTFRMFKFRSMRGDGPNTDCFKSPSLDVCPGGVEGDDRRTRFGAFLRRMSLDELPQLLNVLRGDMSLVGPRPERPEFVEIFRKQIHRYDERHRLKSGITGWAQISGLRGKTSLADRVEWDNWYIENCSPWLDFKILLATVRAVFSSPGVE